MLLTFHSFIDPKDILKTATSLVQEQHLYWVLLLVSYWRKQPVYMEMTMRLSSYTKRYEERINNYLKM